MELKINKTASVLLVLLLLFGSTLVYVIVNQIDTDATVYFELKRILLSQFVAGMANLDKLIIGIWLFVMAKKHSMQPFTWLLLGLAFGKFALIYWGVELIRTNGVLQSNLLKALLPLLVLLSICLVTPLLSKAAIPFVYKIFPTNGSVMKVDAQVWSKSVY